MTEFFEFAQKHWMLFAALVAIVVMLVITEVQRHLRGNRSVSPMEALRLINDEDALLLDVRDVAEFRSGHIPEARNLPVAEFERRITELEKYRSRPVIVCCQSGSRSPAIVARLGKQGFARVRCLAGGIVAWQGASLPLVKK